jgi:hypothetical protein
MYFLKLQLCNKNKVNTNLCALILFPVQLMLHYIIQTLQQFFDLGTGLFGSI